MVVQGSLRTSQASLTPQVEGVPGLCRTNSGRKATATFTPGLPFPSLDAVQGLLKRQPG